MFGIEAYFANIQLFGEELRKRLNERSDRDITSRSSLNKIKRYTSGEKPIET